MVIEAPTQGEGLLWLCNALDTFKHRNTTLCPCKQSLQMVRVVSKAGPVRVQAAHVKQAKRALLQGTSLDTPSSPSLHGMRTLAHMWQGCGAHPRAIEVLSKALDHKRPELQVELLFLRGGPEPLLYTAQHGRRSIPMSDQDCRACPRHCLPMRCCF